MWIFVHGVYYFFIVIICALYKMYFGHVWKLFLFMGDHLRISLTTCWRSGPTNLIFPFTLWKYTLKGNITGEAFSQRLVWLWITLYVSSFSDLTTHFDRKTWKKKKTHNWSVSCSYVPYCFVTCVLRDFRELNVFNSFSPISCIHIVTKYTTSVWISFQGKTI